jgi:lipoprotein-releasing system permease protein
MLGVAGTMAGIAVGLLLSWIVPSLVNAASQMLQQDFMSQYFIGYLPVQILLEDLVLIGGLSIGATVLASFYPAWRAMGLQPSQVLANE